MTRKGEKTAALLRSLANAVADDEPAPDDEPARRKPTRKRAAKDSRAAAAVSRIAMAVAEENLARSLQIDEDDLDISMEDPVCPVFPESQPDSARATNRKNRKNRKKARTEGRQEDAHVDSEEVETLALAPVLRGEGHGGDEHLGLLALRDLALVVLLSIHFCVLKFNYRIRCGPL